MTTWYLDLKENMIIAYNIFKYHFHERVKAAVLYNMIWRNLVGQRCVIIVSDRWILDRTI